MKILHIVGLVIEAMRKELFYNENLSYSRGLY
jgi:hypothetical protein